MRILSWTKPLNSHWRQIVAADAVIYRLRVIEHVEQR